jgi:hypothetical protein
MWRFRENNLSHTPHLIPPDSIVRVGFFIAIHAEVIWHDSEAV